MLRSVVLVLLASAVDSTTNHPHFDRKLTPPAPTNVLSQQTHHFATPHRATVGLQNRAGSNPWASKTGSWDLKQAAVCAFVNDFPVSGTKKPALLTTTFGAVGQTPIYKLTDFDSTASFDPFVSSLTWVNEVQPLSEQVFGKDNLLITAGGFLVPTKSTGTVDLVDATDEANPNVVKVSTDKSGFFYHKTVTHDANGDGTNDILTARATVPILPWKHKSGELLWLEHPQGDPLTQPWIEHVLISGPDVNFIFEDINGDGKAEVITTQYFTTGEVAVYTCTKPLWSDCDSSSIQVDIIDSSDGPFFNLQFVDINHDGLKDLLVTNNRPKNGSLFVFEQLPQNTTTTNSNSNSNTATLPKFKRHTLSSGYSPVSSGTGKGAPGTALAFFPNVTDTNTKPWIILSGDDSGIVDLFVPTVPEDSNDWTYNKTQLIQSSGTVGEIDIGDINGDGIVELFVPFYSEGRVEMWSLTP